MASRAADDAPNADAPSAPREPGTPQDSLARLIEEVASLKATLAGLGKRGAAEARAAADAKLDDLHGELELLADELHRQGQDTLAGVEQRVRDHPLASLLVALGIGMVLGRLLDRR